MKRKTKWLSFVLLLSVVTNSMAVYGAGDVILPSPIEETASDTVELAPTFPAVDGEEIVEWREDGVRHYALGDGRYQAIVTATPESGDAATASTNYNGGFLQDTYISSLTPNSPHGDDTHLRISDSQTIYIKCNTPTLPAYAHVESAAMHCWYMANGESGTLKMKLYTAKEAWTESTLTWASASQMDNFGLNTTSVTGAGLGVYTDPKELVLNMTAVVNRWYGEAPEANHGFALKRIGGQVSSASIVSSEGPSAYRPYVVITYSLDDLPIAEGTYYIRSGKYPSLFVRTNDSLLDPDDDNSTGVEAGDSFCELLSPFEGSNIDYMKWEFSYLNNGYYTIRNVTEMACLTVQEGKENSNGYILTREFFTGYENQQWKITKLPNNRYKIEPRSAEAYTTQWAMSASDVGTEAGYNVIQRANDGSEDIRNEWYIQPLSNTPQKEYTFTITYDNASEAIINENGENVEDVLQGVYQDVSTCLLMMYGIELKIPTISKVSNPSFSNECPTGEHEVVEDYITDISSTTERICHYAGYPLCNYKASTNDHSPANGAAYPNCIDAVISTATTYERGINMKITTLHELSHTFGATHENCIEGQRCALRNNFGYWCDNCHAAINNFLGGTS